MMQRLERMAFSLILLSLGLVITPSQAFPQEIIFHSNLEGRSDIWGINPDGSNRVNLSTRSHDPSGQFNEIQANWSPDGTQIAFVSDKSGVRNLWIMDANGENDRNLTHSAVIEANPQWSTDGSRIFFASTPFPGPGGSCALCPRWEIFVLDLNDSTETQLTSNSLRDLAPVVSPDGSMVAFTRAERANDCCNPTGVWVMNVDGSNQQPSVDTANFYEWIGDWSAETGQLLFGQMIDCAQEHCFEAVLSDPDGSNQVRLTSNDSYDFPTAFSPDSQRIAFVSKRTGFFEIWIMDLDGTNPVQLTHDATFAAGADWRRLPNQPPVARCREILVVDADNSCLAQVTPQDLDNGSFDLDGDPIRLSLRPTEPLSLGEHTLTLSVSDDSDAFDDCEAMVEVQDRSAPLPGRSLPLIEEQCSAQVVEVPIAIDNCSGQVTGITRDPLSYDGQGTFTVLWEYVDESGNRSRQRQTVIVKDETGPSVQMLTASPEDLWPPNHKMRPVTLSVEATDNCQGNLVCQILDVTSNEPGVDGDWELTGRLTLNLRAERLGSGAGRTYEILVECNDLAGNSTTEAVTVSVPHDRRP